MFLTRVSLAAAAFALVTAGVSPVPALAAGGLAFDSVTKFIPGSDTPPAPGNFAEDFQTAANPPPAGDTPKLPFGLGKSMGQMQSAMAMFKTGTAEHHYVAGRKHRVDNIVAQTAEITDCGARTLTTLNLKDQTYTVVSLDHPETPSSGGPSGPSRPEPAATDDGSKIALALTTRALGDKTLDGMPAAGYDSDFKTTVTKGDGETHSYTMETTAYYSANEQPAEYCAGVMHASPGMGPSAAAMGQYQTAMRALRDSKGNSRFTVSSSGPALPSDKLALYELVTMKGERGGSFDMLMERGNVHGISENDPVFSVPAGFTKVGS